MDIKTFMHNIANVAKAPATSNIPALEVSQSDMQEIISYCEENNLSHDIANEQEMTFRFAGLNFLAIENDRGEEVGLGGKVVEPQKWQADLSEEDQKVVEANTVTGDAIPPTPVVDPVEEARKDSIPPAEDNAEEQQEPLEEKLTEQTEKTAAGATAPTPPPTLATDATDTTTTSKGKGGKGK